MKRGRVKTIIIIIAAPFLLLVIGAVLLKIVVETQIASAESGITAQSAYAPAAKSLARLCQSDPFFFRDEPTMAPAWTPPEVLDLHPTSVEITSDGARVEFGGGFHHFGYELKRNAASDTDAQNSWNLEFYSEDSPNKALEQFTLDKSDHVEQAAFVRQALVEFERRAGLVGNSERSANERLTFLLKFDEVDLVRKSIHDCGAASPNDWADQLLAFVIDAKTDPAASGRLDAWAQAKGDCAAWLLAAYAHDIAGDDDAADRCTKLALTKPVDDPTWLANNARYRGATICLQLLGTRHYATCAALCDALLSYEDAGDYLAPQITAIRNLARSAVPSDPPPAPPAFEDGTTFEPFKGIDLSRLQAGGTTRPTAAAARASDAVTDPKQARLIAYFDHRIAAEPGLRRNYADKIGYLLSIKRNADALSTCGDAATAFPKWWRPPVTMAMLADAGSAKEAETKLRKWLEDNPAFIHWWYLCRYERNKGRDGDALTALQNAVKCPLENVDDDGTWVPAAFAFDAASYAYRQKQDALVLEIARVWASPRGVYNYVSDDLYAFRAAAELRLGQFAAAKSDAATVVRAPSEHAIWAQHLSELQKAANEQDRNFNYEPGSLGSDWTLFPVEAPSN
jgi:hypothetical protein